MSEAIEGRIMNVVTVPAFKGLAYSKFDKKAFQSAAMELMAKYAFKMNAYCALV